MCSLLSIYVSYEVYIHVSYEVCTAFNLQAASLKGRVELFLSPSKHVCKHCCACKLKCHWQTLADPTLVIW